MAGAVLRITLKLLRKQRQYSCSFQEYAGQQIARTCDRIVLAALLGCRFSQAHNRRDSVRLKERVSSSLLNQKLPSGLAVSPQTARKLRSSNCPPLGRNGKPWRTPTCSLATGLDSFGEMDHKGELQIAQVSLGSRSRVGAASCSLQLTRHLQPFSWSKFFKIY